MKRKAKVPDLRNDQITMEHCRLLIPYMKQAVLLIGSEPRLCSLIDDITAEGIFYHFQDEWNPQVFCRLYQTAFGKGVLVSLLVVKTLYEYQASTEGIEDEL